MTADFKQGATLVGKILASSQVATANSGTTIYTVPALSAAKIATFVLTNTSTSAVTVNVSVVPSGGTLDATHKLVSNYTLAGNDSTKVTEVEGAFLDAGAFISVSATAATVLNYFLTGAVSA